MLKGIIFSMVRNSTLCPTMILGVSEWEREPGHYNLSV